MVAKSPLKAILQKNPLRTLVVDEAGQINVDGYLSILDGFQSTLRKMCFIGDDKQCTNISHPMALHCGRSDHLFSVPPHGKEDIQDLKSIFDVAHLRKSSLLLDTQCNMIILNATAPSLTSCTVFQTECRHK